MSRKQEKLSKNLNYFEHSLNLASVIAGCISSSDFTSLLGIFIGITSSAIGLKILPIVAR